MILAIDGLDGSGKSRLAARVAEALTSGGRAANILHVDDFRRPLDFTGLDAAAEAALYYERYYDFAALEAALAERGGDAGPLTIVEGVMLLRARLPAEACLAVLEVSPAEARRRIQERDQAKGRSVDEVTRRIDRRYFPAQARYRQAHDPLGRADLVVDNDDWRRPRVVRRAERLPPLFGQALATALELA